MTIVPQLILNSVVAGAVYTMIALGFTLIFSVTKFLNIAHGVMATIGGYFVFYFTQRIGLGLWPSIVFGVIGVAFFAYVSDLLVYAPLLKKRSSVLTLLVASLGIFTVAQAVLAILFTSQFQTLSVSVPNQHVYMIGSGTITEVQLITLVCGIGITIFLIGILKKTTYGKSVVAISDDSEVAQIIGINTRRVITSTFLIGSAIAGLAGILIGLDTGIEPTMGLLLILKGVIASVIGGIGNIYGAIAGAFILGFVENFGIWKISGEWKDAIAFGLLILFLIFKPRGLFAD